MKTLVLPLLAALLAMVMFVAPGGGSVAAQAADDACGIAGVFDVPDSGATFDFTEACAAHDACYSAGGTEADRNACDAAFLQDMRDSCADMWPTQRLRRLVCEGVAATYYLGVHAFGWLFFPYSG